MNAIVERVVTFLGLEGSRGAELEAIWAAAAQGSAFTADSLPTAVKQRLWSHILDSQVFVVYARARDPKCTEKEPTQISGDIPKKHAGKVEVLGYAVDRPKVVRDVGAALGAGLFVVLAKAVRDACVNIQSRQSDFQGPQCSPLALAALEAIARSRDKGVLQSELPSMFNMQPTHFHYVIKQLLARNLVTKTATRIKNVSQSVSQTAVLHLRAEAPPLALTPTQNMQFTGGREDVSLEDTAALQKAVAEKLAQLPGCMASEAELKKYFKLSNISGHRAWRTTRGGLVKVGFVEQARGTLEGHRGTVDMLRLLKPWVESVEPLPEPFADWPNHGPGDGLLPLDLPLHRGVVEAMLAAGEAGMTSEEICSRFAITSKLLAVIMKSVLPAFELEHFREQGDEHRRQQQFRYRIPAALRAQLQPALTFQSQAHLRPRPAPPVPAEAAAPQGTAGVAVAGERDASAAQEAATARQQPAQQDCTAPEAAPCSLLGSAATEPPAGTGEAGDGATGASGSRAAEGATAAAASTPQLPRERSKKGDQVTGKSSGNGERVSVSVIREHRKIALRNHLARTGFLLQTEVRYIWLKYAEKEGLSLSLKDADTKTVNRLLEALLAANDIGSEFELLVPVLKSRLGVAGSRPVRVFIPPDKVWAPNELKHVATVRQQFIDKVVRSKAYIGDKVVADVPTVNVAGALGQLITHTWNTNAAATGAPRSGTRSGGASPGAGTADEDAPDAGAHLDGSVGATGRTEAEQGKRKRSEGDAERPQSRPRLLRYCMTGYRAHFMNRMNTSGVLPLKSYRIRALHLRLLRLVGIHGSGPDSGLAGAYQRPLPAAFQARLVRRLKLASEAITPRPEGGWNVVLDPGTVFLCLRVCQAFRIIGTGSDLSTEVMKAAWRDQRYLYEVPDSEIKTLFDEGAFDRCLGLLRMMTFAGLIVPYDPSSAAGLGVLAEPIVGSFPQFQTVSSDFTLCREGLIQVAVGFENALKLGLWAEGHRYASQCGASARGRPPVTDTEGTCAAPAATSTPVGAAGGGTEHSQNPVAAGVGAAAGVQAETAGGGGDGAQQVAGSEGPGPIDEDTEAGGPARRGAAQAGQEQNGCDRAAATEVPDLQEAQQERRLAGGDARSGQQQLAACPAAVALAASPDARPGLDIPVLGACEVHLAPDRPGVLRCTYDVTCWAGWCQYWDHMAVVRKTKGATSTHVGLFPFSRAADLLTGRFPRKNMRFIAPELQALQDELGRPATDVERKEFAAENGMSCSELQYLLAATEEPQAPVRLGKLAGGVSSGRLPAPAAAPEGGRAGGAAALLDRLSAGRAAEEAEQAAAEPTQKVKKPLKRRRRRPAEPGRTVKMFVDAPLGEGGAPKRIYYYSSDASEDEPELALQKRDLRRARAKLEAFTGIPVSMRRDLKGEVADELVRAAGLFVRDDRVEARRKRIRPTMEHFRIRRCRWSEPEERAMLVAEVRVAILAGSVDIALLPWGRFRGVGHGSSACCRRIQVHRQVKPTNPGEPVPHKEMMAAALRVHELRMRQCGKELVALIDREMERLSVVGAQRGGAGEAGGEAAEDEEDVPALLLMLPPEARKVLPWEAAEAVLTPDPLVGVDGSGAVFTAHGEEEAALREQIVEWMEAVFSGIQITNRVLREEEPDPGGLAWGTTQVAAGWEKQARPRSRFLKRKKRVTLHMQGLRQFVKSSKALIDANSSLATLPWRCVQCARRVMGLVLHSDLGEAPTAEAQTLLSTFPNATVTRTVAELQMNFFIVRFVGSPLQLALSRRVLAQAELLLRVVPDPDEAAAAARRLLRCEAGSADAVLPAALQGVLSVGPDDHVGVGLLSVALTGLSLLECEIHALRVDQAVEADVAAAGTADAAQTDETAERAAYAVELVPTAACNHVLRACDTEEPGGQLLETIPEHSVTAAMVLALRGAAVGASPPMVGHGGSGSGANAQESDSHGELQEAPSSGSHAPGAVPWADVLVSAATNARSLFFAWGGAPAFPAPAPSALPPAPLVPTMAAVAACTHLCSQLQEAVASAGEGGQDVLQLADVLASGQHASAMCAAARALLPGKCAAGASLALSPTMSRLLSKATEQPAQNCARHAAVLAVLQVLLQAMVDSGLVVLTPNALLSGVQVVEPKHCSLNEKQPFLPWVKPDGRVDLLVLYALVSQMVALLCCDPGLTVDCIAARMAHVLDHGSCEVLLDCMTTAGFVQRLHVTKCLVQLAVPGGIEVGLERLMNEAGNGGSGAQGCCMLPLTFVRDRVLLVLGVESSYTLRLVKVAGGVHVGDGQWAIPKGDLFTSAFSLVCF